MWTMKGRNGFADSGCDSVRCRDPLRRNVVTMGSMSPRVTRVVIVVSW
jgi:hypothetical protein